MYAYKNPTQIDLVISEAGPTNFLEHDEQGNLILPDEKACTRAGVMYDDSEDVKEGKLRDASPLKYVTSNAPYTILAYGNEVEPKDGVTTYTGNVGDGIIPYSHAIAVYNTLGSGKCSLFELKNIKHEDYGEGKKVYPGSTEDIIKEYYSCEEEDNSGLKQLINILLFGNTNS